MDQEHVKVCKVEETNDRSISVSRMKTRKCCFRLQIFKIKSNE